MLGQKWADLKKMTEEIRIKIESIVDVQIWKKNKCTCIIIYWRYPYFTFSYTVNCFTKVVLQCTIISYLSPKNGVFAALS